MTWQPAAITFPDVELVAAEKMRVLLATAGHPDVHVDRAVPNPRATEMLVLTRDGGGNNNTLDRPRIRARIWASTDPLANDLARLVVGLFPLMADGDPITKVTCLSGPYDVTDESKQPQRYALFELNTRGEATS